MTRKTTDSFCTAVSDKDFIFGVFSKNDLYSICDSIAEESPIGSGSCKSEHVLFENVQNEDSPTGNLD